MAAQVATIANEHHLTDDASTVPEDERRLSKREDHDALPGLRVVSPFDAKLLPTPN